MEKLIIKIHDGKLHFGTEKDLKDYSSFIIEGGAEFGQQVTVIDCDKKNLKYYIKYLLNKRKIYTLDTKLLWVVIVVLILIFCYFYFLINNIKNGNKDNFLKLNEIGNKIEGLLVGKTNDSERYRDSQSIGNQFLNQTKNNE